jgi:hypothetical protein
LSTLALSGSSQVKGGSRIATAIRYSDLFLLCAALAVFLLAGFPMLGFAVAAGVWLAQRGVQLISARRAAAALARSDRKGALGVIAATTLGRVWLVALAVLLVGLAERKAGLSAAILAAVLFTAYFAGQFVARLIEPSEDAR